MTGSPKGSRIYQLKLMTGSPKGLRIHPPIN